MEPLADASALEARLGRALTEAEAARVDALLADASAKVRRYCRRDFTAVADAVVTTRGESGSIRLPQTPVTDVTSVVAVGDNGLPDLTLAGWYWDGIDTIDLGGIGSVINFPESWWDGSYHDTYRVTYDYGDVVVPDDIVAKVCEMTLRCLTAPTMTPGLTSETIGPYSYRLDEPGGGTAVRLTQDDKDDLADYRRKAGATRVRMG